MEVMIPPWVRPENPERITLLDDGTQLFQPAFARGTSQAQIWADPRWQFTRRYRGMRSDQKAALLSALSDARGKGVTIRLTPHATLRGSFPTSELLSNNTFENGTTGWTTSVANQLSLSASDRVLRGTRTAGNSSVVLVPSAAATVVAFAPYVARAMIMQGLGTINQDIRIGSTSGGADYARSAANSPLTGLIMAAGVPAGTTAYFGLTDSIVGVAKSQGEYFETPYVSLSRCALVDNAPNLLLQSDDFTTTWTNTNSTDAANSTFAPDNTSTADSIIEDSSASTVHYVQQSVTVSADAADYCFSVALKASTRTFSRVLMLVGSSSVNTYINLSTGALGATGTGASWSDLRRFVVDLGNGWYRVFLVARKTSADTTLICRIELANSAPTDTYTGDGASLIFAWRAALTQSSVPVRATQTTTTATTGSAQNGAALYLKGLPASTSGLLLTGDWASVNGELKQTTTPLNSDAAGLGYWQFRPAIGESPADNDPVEIFEPWGRFRLMNGAEYENMWGTYADAEIEFTEVYE